MKVFKPLLLAGLIGMPLASVTVLAQPFAPDQRKENSSPDQKANQDGSTVPGQNTAAQPSANGGK
jgi:hypothetical protein